MALQICSNCGEKKAELVYTNELDYTHKFHYMKCSNCNVDTPPDGQKEIHNLKWRLKTSSHPKVENKLTLDRWTSEEIQLYKQACINLGGHNLGDLNTVHKNDILRKIREFKG